MRAFVFSILLWSFATGAAAQDWNDPDLGRHVAEGAATRQHLWLRGGDGVLVRFDRTTGERVVLGRDVIDILPDGDHLWALSGSREGSMATLRDLRDEGFNWPALNLEQGPAGLVKGDGDLPDILATESLLVRGEGRWRRLSFAAPLTPSGWTAKAAGGDLYVGYNRGEWGGGLRRIDPRSGAVSFVSNAGDGCGGELNPACAPVVGLFSDRRAPDCVIVGTGLAHLGMRTGDVYRVCGTTISSVFSTPTPAERDQRTLAPQPWPLFALVETDDGWIGLSEDRYFRMRNDRVEERPMPAFQDWSGLRISAEEDGVLFVVSACCWGSVNKELFSTVAIPVAP
jgi:hypothetical protein